MTKLFIFLLPISMLSQITFENDGFVNVDASINMLSEITNLGMDVEYSKAAYFKARLDYYEGDVFAVSGSIGANLLFSQFRLYTGARIGTFIDNDIPEGQAGYLGYETGLMFMPKNDGLNLAVEVGRNYTITEFTPFDTFWNIKIGYTFRNKRAD